MFHRPKFRFLTSALAAALLVLTLTPLAYGAGTASQDTSNATIDATALATVPAVSKDGVTSFQGMEFLHVINTQDQNSDYMWVVGMLSDSTPLPAKVSLPIPKGSQITWLGEMDASSGAEQQLSVPAPKTEGDQDFYTFTVTKYRMIRAEFPSTNPFKASTTATGTAVMAANLSFKAPSDLMFLYLGAEVPAGKAVLSPDFEDGGEMPSGNHIYIAALSEIKAGKTYSATLMYAKSSSSKDPTNPLVIIAIVALVIAVAALLFMIVRKRFGSADGQ